MKVRFYPRNIGMFRNGDFDFSMRGITLSTKLKLDYKDFHDRSELIEYLKNRGVRLDDYGNPLEFIPCDNIQYGIGYNVIQWSYLGFMVEL